MPNARRDRAGREQLLGSMRSTLLALHAETGEAAPLCRLQALLKEHAEALTVAWPEEPNMLEIRNARARHEEVTKQLGATMAPALARRPWWPRSRRSRRCRPRSSRRLPRPPSRSPLRRSDANSTRADTLARKQLIAGSVVLPLGIVALGVLGGVGSNFGATWPPRMRCMPNWRGAPAPRTTGPHERAAGGSSA
jgi:hypothetical protein